MKLLNSKTKTLSSILGTFTKTVEDLRSFVQESDLKSTICDEKRKDLQNKISKVNSEQVVIKSEKQQALNAIDKINDFIGQ